MQVSQQPGGGLGTGVVRRPVRQQHRHEIHHLLYVNLDHANGGIIRNLSDCGAGLQSVTPLRPHEQVHVRFDLLQPRLRLETSARVCWANTSGQAGIVFSSLPEKSRRLLQDWLLTQLLARAEQLFGKESVFQAPQNPAPGLTLSGAGRDPFSLLISPRYRSDSFGMRIKESPRLLSAIVDSLVLAIAVLLFAVIAVSIAHTIPTWPISAVVLAATITIFCAVYWGLSFLWTRPTPGRSLVQAALGEDEQSSLIAREPQARFR